MEVRARENIAVTSEVIVGGERPELEERAPDTTDLRARNARGLGAIDSGIVRPIDAIDVVVVSEVVVKAEVAITSLKVALGTSLTKSKEFGRVVDSSLATVSPVVVLIDAEVAIASTIISGIEGAVELTEIITNSVTSSLELDVAKRVVNPTTSSGLVVGDAIVGVTSNNGVISANSGVGDIAVKVIASSTAASAVKVGVVEHTTSLIVGNVVIIAHGGDVAADIAPVPVSTAVGVVKSLSDTARGGEHLTKARVAEAPEDVAEVVRALTILTLATVAAREVRSREGNEAESLVNESRAVNDDAIGVATSEIAVLAELKISLATVGRIAVAIPPASFANDVAPTSPGPTSRVISKSLVTHAVAVGASSIGGVNVILLSPGLTTVVAATSIRLRIGDPRAVETVEDSIVGSSIEGTGGLPASALSQSVLHGELATVLPVTVVVAAESIIAGRGDSGTNLLTKRTTSIALRESIADLGEAGIKTVGDNVGASTSLDAKRTLRPVSTEGLDVLSDATRGVSRQALGRADGNDTGEEDAGSAETSSGAA